MSRVSRNLRDFRSLSESGFKPLCSSLIAVHDSCTSTASVLPRVIETREFQRARAVLRVALVRVAAKCQTRQMVAREATRIEEGARAARDLTVAPASSQDAWPGLQRSQS